MVEPDIRTSVYCDVP